VNSRDCNFFFVFGLGLWMIGTLGYAYAAPAMLETGALRFWLSFCIAPLVSAAICILLLRRRRIPGRHWASAMLLIALPGMAGEAVVLTHLATFMPRLHAATGGPYGAFLFATYALALGAAEVVTLRARC
jgi:Family of unknown function (DUF5367)